MAPTQFAVDKMLGRLAAWLRLLGYDATYGGHLGGRTLVRHARQEQRTILTRDHKLLRERNTPPIVFIESDHFRDQVGQVVRACGLDPLAHLFHRCLRCNEAVVAVPKSAVAGRVPPYVFDTQSDFARCPRCGRIFWPGTHVERVRAELRAMGLSVPSDVHGA